MAVVYIHMKPHNNEIYYVGIGNKAKRAGERTKRSELWNRYYKKYGLKSEIICRDISLEEAKKIEIWLISFYGKSNLCNRTLGGEGFFGGKHSEECKRRIKEKKMGTIVSEETKAKISAKLKGHPNYNLSHTEEAKAKISAALKGKKRDAVFCQRVKESKIGYRPHKNAIDAAAQYRRDRASIFQETTTGFVGKIWEHAEKFNIDRRVVYYNYKREFPVLVGSGKGLNFIKIT